VVPTPHPIAFAAADASKRATNAALDRADERRRELAASTAAERARAAKRRELDALDEALVLHLAAAAMQRESGHPDRATDADARAATCREAMVLARQERDQAEERLAGRKPS
jgi:hypothetical protein